MIVASQSIPTLIKPGNFYIKPGPNGISINSLSNIFIYSSNYSSTCEEKSFIDIEIYILHEHIKIYKDELILESENKDKLGKEFVNFLYNSFKVGNDSFVSMNNYFKYYPNVSKFALLLESDKSPSSDWKIIEKMCSRYLNMKAFW